MLDCFCYTFVVEPSHSLVDYTYENASQLFFFGSNNASQLGFWIMRQMTLLKSKRKLTSAKQLASACDSHNWHKLKAEVL